MQPPKSCISDDISILLPTAAPVSGVSNFSIPVRRETVFRCVSIRLTVGKSKMRVSGSSADSPRRPANRLRNSTAPSESSPASMSAASAETSGNSSATTSCSFRSNKLFLSEFEKQVNVAGGSVATSGTFTGSADAMTAFDATTRELALTPA